MRTIIFKNKYKPFKKYKIVKDTYLGRKKPSIV